MLLLVIVLGGAFNPGTKPGITPGVLVKLDGWAGATLAGVIDGAGWVAAGAGAGAAEDELDVEGLVTGWTAGGAAGAAAVEDETDGEGLPIGRIEPLSVDTGCCKAEEDELSVIVCACAG